MRFTRTNVCGVSIVTGITDPSKVVWLAKQLYYERHVNKVSYVNCGNYVIGDSRSLLNWLRKELRIPQTLDLGSYFSKKHILKTIFRLFDTQNRPVLLIIDNFDKLIVNNNYKLFVTSLAENSSLSKSYLVLIMIDDCNVAKDILRLNNGQKILSLFDRKELLILGE
jgi:Cdc6-like AAA superfamily ATPase